LNYASRPWLSETTRISNNNICSIPFTVLTQNLIDHIEETMTKNERQEQADLVPANYPELSLASVIKLPESYLSCELGGLQK
jgi:hypothetical protein